MVVEIKMNVFNNTWFAWHTSWLYRKIKLSLDRAWARKDEFHPSLSFDALMYYSMSENERKEYIKDLCRRRELAHMRDMNDMVK